MKILLMCYGGLSTGIMKVRIQEEAKKDEYIVEVNAISLTEGLQEYNDYDIYLLGPQVRYAENELKEKVGNKPVIVISATDFGLMRGDNVWQEIKKTLKI